ncbi:hypothetical protein GLOIN_2v1846634 [Rhizophagus clarus]|uniref:Uncharacterized protein n=1 Tax=Rhizophagus clarus TaxID=94130 RepID=A0A8H3LB32_9GLOM|nr:hypothetical protein GLOIN_2v1846634 [Rhizophagus clarus]
MNWFIHLFIFSFFILISTADPACICNSGNGFGLYCGFELAGGDCDGMVLAHVFQCGGPNTNAQDLGPCKYGCCSQDSHCCLDQGCTGCPDSKWQRPQSNDTNFPTATTQNTSTSQPKNISSNQPSASSSPTQPGSSSDIATILGAVIGGICAIFAAIIGVKCKKQKQNKQINQQQINQNEQKSRNEQINQIKQNNQINQNEQKNNQNDQNV